jgi:hypothetical protein
MTDVYIDRFEVFCAWHDWWRANGGFHYFGWGDGDWILKNLKENPVKVTSKGRKEGWWKK